MEWIVGVLTGAIALIAPVGTIGERLLEDLIRDQLVLAESLEVRVDHVPTHQLLDGRVDRIRIAGRGLYPLPDARIDVLDIETDPIDLSMSGLREGDIALQEPLQAAVHLVLTEEDIQAALQSETVVSQLEEWSEDIFGEGLEGYDLVDPQVEFLGDRRMRVEVLLASRSDDAEPVAIAAELGVAAEGAEVEIIDPEITIDNESLPVELVNPVIRGLNEQLDLRSLEEDGITARLLEWDFTADELSVAAFVKVEPGALD